MFRLASMNAIRRAASKLSSIPQVGRAVESWPKPQIKSLATLKELDSAESAWQKSCYFEIDFTIKEDATVYEAVQRFAAFNIGALVTVDARGE